MDFIKKWKGKGWEKEAFSKEGSMPYWGENTDWRMIPHEKCHLKAEDFQCHDMQAKNALSKYLSIKTRIGKQKPSGCCSFGSQICLQLGFPCGSSGKNLPANAGDVRDAGLIPGSGRDSTEKGRATHSSVLAWRIPWTEEPGGESDVARVHMFTTNSALWRVLWVECSSGAAGGPWPGETFRVGQHYRRVWRGATLDRSWGCVGTRRASGEPVDVNMGVWSVGQRGGQLKPNQGADGTMRLEEHSGHLPSGRY